MINISNIFLVQFWRLQASSKPFYNSSKINLQQDMLIFNNWYFPFLIFSVHLLKRVNEKLYTSCTWLLSNWSLLLNQNVSGIRYQSSKRFKIFQKNVAPDNAYYLTKFIDLIIYYWKYISKKNPFSEIMLIMTLQITNWVLLEFQISWDAEK